MATKTELEAQVKQLEEQLNTVKKIQRAAQDLNNAEGEAGLLEALAQPFVAAGVASVSLFYVDTSDVDGEQWMELAADWPPGDAGGVPLGTRIRLSDYSFSKLWQVGDVATPLLVSDTHTDERVDAELRQLWDSLNIRAIINLPMRQGARWVGVVSLQWTVPYSFTEVDEEICHALIELATPVAENRRLVANLEQMVTERAGRLQRSERILQTVLDAIPVRVFWKNKDLDYLGCNALFAGDAGLDSSQEIAGKSDFDLPWGEQAELFRDDDSAVINSGEARINFEEPQSQADGTLAWLRTSKVPLTDDDGNIIGILGTYDDITEEKKAEAALRNTETRLNTILSNLPIVIFAVDKEGTFTLSDGKGLEVLGLLPGQVVGASVFDVYKDVPAILNDVQRCLAGEVLRTTLGLGPLFFDAWYIPLIDAQGEVEGILGVSIDVSQRQQAQIEREQMRLDLIEAQQNALRELSTPVIPIMENIIIVPLIGNIDSARSQDVMRALLAGISQHRAKVVILDITGVPVVDTGVADSLNKTIQAARLKGTHTIVTGVSDAVAETIVDLGIDWGDMETLRDLQTGLVTAIKRLGMTFGH